MEGEWKEAREWNDSLYVDWFNNIEQKKGGKLITEKSYNMLRSTLFECAANKLRDSFSASLLAENYSDKKVKTMRHGVDTLIKYEEIKSVSSQPRLTHIQDAYDLYSNIKNFISVEHKITSSFNTSGLNWVSFKKKQDNIIGTAKAYKNNPLYKEMNTVPGFADGLDESKLMSMTEKYRTPFYDNLSDQIIRYFEYVIPVRDTAIVANKKEIYTSGSYEYVDLDKLNEVKQRQLGGVYRQFDDETADNNSGFRKLFSFKNRFGKALQAI